MEELLKQENELLQIIKNMEKEESVLENKLDAIRRKISSDTDKLKEILEQKEEIMIEEDTFFDDKVGIEVDGEKFVLSSREPSRLLSKDLAESRYENSDYDISLEEISSRLAYRFVNATKKWVETKAPNPKRLLIPVAELEKMVEAGHVVYKMK